MILKAICAGVGFGSGTETMLYRERLDQNREQTIHVSLEQSKTISTSLFRSGGRGIVCLEIV